VLKLLRKAGNRIRLKRKNPRAFEDFCRRFTQHSAQGCAQMEQYIGLDVSLKETSICVVDGDGEIVSVRGAGQG
jgi:hypothetical protein